MRRIKVISAFILLAAALFFIQPYCPTPGVALSARHRALNHLKNRTALPQAEDFDHQVTLARLLEPGDDRARWSVLRAAVVEGYVVAVYNGGIESANCFSCLRRDTHIEVALRPDAPRRERVVLEVTPRLRRWARGQGRDWSTSGLKRELLGHWCRFEGWLFFDEGHAAEAEQTAPGNAGTWRATAWEVHPVTDIGVVK